jgi:signal transduction histidine kinase
MLVLRRAQLLRYGMAVLLLSTVTLVFWPNLLARTFSTQEFMPHGMCYLWNSGVVWLHVISDLLIGLSYVAISATLAYLVHRARRDIPFTWVFLAFGLFIIACGSTHFMEIVTLWTPLYWLSGEVKLVTAVASVATALAIPPLIPKTLRLIQSAKLSEARQQQLAEAHQELATLYAKLKELDELKTQFFANVSHELRTPLALILGPAQKLAAAGELTDSQRHDLAVIERNARTLLKHVNDLLDVSKLEAGKMEMRYTETDLARLVRFVAGHFDGLAAERQLQFTVEAPAALPAQVDAEKLQRVLLNLLSNAFKFTPGGGQIRCHLERAGAQLLVSVEDSGPGVPPELRDVIFERFRQAEGGSTRRFGGTGLGLSIAKEFVELHQGTLRIADAPGGGAAFTLTLPAQAPVGMVVQPALAESAVTEELAQQALAELRQHVEAVAVAPAAERPLVLIVEDNVEMNHFLVETLAAEYRTATAFDGQTGLQQALTVQPDLILTDVMMPQMSGDQLVRAVRQHAALDDVPIVVLTAKADDELRVQLLKAGAQDYLMKPFTLAELRARVGNLVTLKRARAVLQRELVTQLQDLESLAREVSFRKRELQTALAEMQVAREQAERASAIKSDFLRLVSHELRTPLNGISGYLQLLKRQHAEVLTPPQRLIVDRISAASARMLELVESLLEYVRSQSGHLQVSAEPFQLEALAAASVEELQPQAEQAHLALQLVSGPALPPLHSDPRLVRLILSNLIGNAIKYTREGEITIHLAHAAGWHCLTVQDTGPGIPPEQQVRVFEPFTQLEPLGQKHTPGFGLGLALVKQLVEALAGEIELSSAPGQGSRFTVRLPSVMVTPPAFTR